MNGSVGGARFSGGAPAHPNTKRMGEGPTWTGRISDAACLASLDGGARARGDVGVMQTTAAPTQPCLALS
jgi:hypothetical protein